MKIQYKKRNESSSVNHPIRLKWPSSQIKDDEMKKSIIASMLAAIASMIPVMVQNEPKQLLW